MPRDLGKFRAVNVAPPALLSYGYHAHTWHGGVAISTGLAFLAVFDRFAFNNQIRMQCGYVYVSVMLPND